MPEFESLPWRENHAGEPRRVGVEMEMAGLDAGRIAAAVVAELGGEFESESAFSGNVHGTRLGDFRIELDASLLTSRGYLDTLKKLGIEIEPGELRDNLESVLSRLAGLVVPHELVCPPVAVDRLPRIDAIRARLHQAGACGTHSSALYAFGLQFNVEVHDTGAGHLLSVLRAFFLAFPGIVERENIDFSRKLTPFVQPFPADYVARVLDPDYRPDRDRLIDDFLTSTPTRNRPLDLLPLFAWLDEERVMAAPVERHLIKPRPTWHYRLPNCLIDDPDWSLHAPWAEWVRVERLAADPERLARSARARLQSSSVVRRWLSGAFRGVKNGLARLAGRR
ncbi:MAG: amidoligase family protein [Wenzhouxiangellaceae bacterium]|nr:amidoligase family protein [Wenzhouxiangellaceae bacterium]